MATLSIPWNDGDGNIVLTYTGEGNDTVVVTSDTDNLGKPRQQTVTFVVKDGAIRNTIETSGGNQIRTSDGHILRSLDNSMKVTVTVVQTMSTLKVLVTSNDHVLVTSSGNILRCSTPTN